MLVEGGGGGGGGDNDGCMRSARNRKILLQNIIFRKLCKGTKKLIMFMDIAIVGGRRQAKKKVRKKCKYVK